MNIYELIFYDDFLHEKSFICKIKNREDIKKLKNGLWYSQEKIEIDIIQEGEKYNFIKNTDKLLIVDRNVKECFATYHDIQFIPVEIDEEEFYVVNILRIINDSLDKENSMYMVYADDFPNEKVRGKIGTIWKVVLFQNKLKYHIFRINEHINSTFVDEDFKTIVERNNFTGIDFHKITLS